MKSFPVGSAVLFAVALFAGGCAANGSSPAGPNAAPAADAQLPGRFEVVGRGAVVGSHTSDMWVFQGVDGRDYALTGTWGACDGCFGDRLYVWDVSDPAKPVLSDSVMVDARVVNDVKVNAAGTVAVLTREGASSRRNGIILLDLSNPAHPTVASDYWETLTGGVHNTFVDGNYVYAVNDGTADLHVIDISDIKNPTEVGRYGIPIKNGKYLHDVWVKDGLAYLSYWDDGVIIVDVGKGIRQGTPQDPKFVSQYKYRTTWKGKEYGNTHVVFPYTNRAGRSYLFVGDEIFPDDFDDRNPRDVPGGYVHVIDVSDIENPTEVAKYEVPGAGVHNLWVENDTLYTAYYNGGLRAVDVSGELRGDLRSQNREIAVLSTTDAQAFIANRPFTWGPQLYKGLVYASDHNSGLWITRVVPAGTSATTGGGR